MWKKRSGGPEDTERIVYEEVSQDPAIRDIVPRYYREVEYQGEKFIELQDLLHGFQVINNEHTYNFRVYFIFVQCFMVNDDIIF